MRLGIIGKKVGQTQIFDENGINIPVTVIDTTDCVVTQVKTKDVDGYTAVQVGYGTRKPQNVNKPISGHLKKAGVGPKARVKEIRFNDSDDMSGFTPGAKLNVAMFQVGDLVDVTATTIGRGFQGVMKRHGFHGADATHGVHTYFRHGGSAGTNTFPGRILKNKGMPGQMGNVPRTIQKLKVVAIHPEQNLILVRGAVPGPKTGAVLVRSTIKKPDPTGRTLTA